MGEVIDFETARKTVKRYQNKFAVMLAEAAQEIRLGNYDPDMMYISFRIPHPSGKGVAYPSVAVDMDRDMAHALRKDLTFR